MLATLSAVGAVTSYTVRVTADGETALTSLTAFRGSASVTFDAGKLIGARLTHFKSDANANLVVPAACPLPSASSRDRLLDTILNRGAINPGGQDTAPAGAPVLAGPDATPGLAVAFDRAVTNLPGDDVVFFEFQREIASPLGGDPVRFCPLGAGEGLRSITVKTYDIPFKHPSARPVGGFDCYASERAPASLHDLQTAPRRLQVSHDEFRALAVGIDLSDLGFPANARVDGLFVQNATARGPVVDPVCIVGLPAPEPPNILTEEPAGVVVETSGTRLLERFLAGPMAGVEDIVFAVRASGTDHWYANFGFYAAPVREYPPQREPDGVKMQPIFKGGGGRLCRLNLRTRDVSVLLTDSIGAVRDPQVHYDGQRVLFSYRKGGESCFHLYEIDVDGTGLRQLTDGPYNDIEPTYLPDGGIMFCSDRCRRYVNCWVTPVATLYRCRGDGTAIRMISSNVEHDNTPWVLNDGRVVYMRWEYVDRNQGAYHHLWTVNPDGSGQMTFFGNLHPGFAMLDAKPIPGSNRVVASFSPGHGRPEHAGHVTVVDVSLGPDERAFTRRVSRGNPNFRDPYAFSEDCFLVAEGKRVLLMNGRGRMESVYELPTSDRGLECHEPRPLAPRPREPVIPARTDPSKPTGRLVLADVRVGRNMGGVKPGEVRKLLVFAQLPKPVNFSGGPWPISIGGTFTLSRVLGTVPVEADGSAHFEAPALQPLFFVALDGDDRSVKRMQSFVTVQPGETTSCVGCHEERVLPPPTAFSPRLKAMRRPPSRIEPVADVPDVLDFTRDVQPILDRHCVRCHSPEQFRGRLDLCGDHTPLFSQSYWAITQRGLASDGRNEARGSLPPRAIGSSASPLLEKLDGSHHDVRPTSVEVKTIRLWIESSAVYAGTYAALGSGLTPVRFPVETMVRRCGSCHGSEPPHKPPIGQQKTYFRFGKKGPHLPLVHTLGHLRDIRGRIGYFKFGSARPPQSLCNLSRPEKSLLVRAPLSKHAGGLGLCPGDVFADADDPGYRSMLEAIREAGRRLQEQKRFDMPGFRPNDYYLHQMGRYGVLDRELGVGDPVDPYELDRTYWALFDYRPPADH